VENLPRLICLMGPTASGKTDLAIELARHLPCELISVDSALVYRGLDIGSAKPDYPHHLIDIRDPAQPYSVAEFCRDAQRLIEEILERQRIPLLVGGTMLYFKTLLEGIAPMPAADERVRAELEAQARSEGWPALHTRLAEVDPVAAGRIHPNHSQRIGRALEVYLSSGVTMTAWRERQASGSEILPGDRYRVQQLAIFPAQRPVLHQRIESRLRDMVAAGLVEEVRALYERGDLHPDLPALRAVGYRQMWGYLAGEYDLNRAVELSIIATRQLAKRQLTWLRGWPNLQAIYTNNRGFAANSPENPETMTEEPVQLALNYLQIATT
jgi:tRNA dimethylallyltransferase